MTQKHSGVEFIGRPVALGTGAKVRLSMRLPMENFRRGVTSPTAVTKNGVAGYLFAADAEALTIQFCVPMEWDGASDLDLILHCVLNQAEAVNDLIDWETSIKSIVDHDNELAAGTQTPGVNHNIGNINADGDFHLATIIIDYDHATCPIAPGANVSIVLSRTANVGDVGYVGGVVLIDVCVEYQTDKLGEAV